MTEHTQPLTLPEFEPTLTGFRAEEFLALTESLLAFPIQHDQTALDAAPFRLERPEPRPEPPITPLPPRWYPRPSETVIEAARASLVPPPRPPIFEGRSQELALVLRPLLAGHPVRVCGESGVGKTALLAQVAAHERTRQRFRRIWWIDQPERLDQTLALALNLPHALAEHDPARRRAWFEDHLDDHTLLIVDNLTPDDPLLEALPALTEHVLCGVETVPGLPDPDEPPPPDPDGVVTLRGLDPADAGDALAAYAGLDDVRRVRAQLVHIVTALGHHPYAILLAGILVRRDGLTLDELEDLLALDAAMHGAAAGEVDAPASGEVAASASDDENAEDEDFPASMLDNPSLNRALDVSVAALPRDYRRLFDAFGAFPPSGAPFDGLADVSRIRDTLATRRGLIMLEHYGLIQRDHRDPDHYIMHPVAYARTQPDEPLAPEDDKRAYAMRSWAGRYVRDHAENPLALYRAEPSLRHAYASAEFGPQVAAEAFEESLVPYLREVVPDEIDTSAARPDHVNGVRREAANLTAYGIELTDDGAYIAAEEALTRALALRKEHDSAHAVAETEVALGRLLNRRGRYHEALDLLLRAAERVYSLGADDSLSVIRRGLARVYRNLGQLAEALEVLDDSPESHYERAVILRAQGNYVAAVSEMRQAGHSTPYDRAEILLLAGRYADALEAIQDDESPESAQLRAQAYHLQGHVTEAMRGYRAALAHSDMALEVLNLSGEADPDEIAAVQRARARTLRGLGAAIANATLEGHTAPAADIGDVTFDAALDALGTALEIYRAPQNPDPAQVGGILRLMAAVLLAAGDPESAVRTARDALDQLSKTTDTDALADVWRTLGRALWRQLDYAGALEAFESEVAHAQSSAERDDARIGIALHHVADAYRATGQLDRAIANYRRALTHKDAAKAPVSFMMTQLALHRALLEADRLAHALDTAQEVVDQLARHADADLQHIGYAQAVRARTQQAAERPIRAQQSLLEWTRTLVSRSEDVWADARPELHVLLLGLAVRSLLAEDRPALALPLAERATQIATQHFGDDPAAWAAIRDLGAVYMAQERPEEAIITLEPLLNADLRDQPDQAASVAHAYALTGHAYRQIDDPENALAHLRLAFDYEPDKHLKSLVQEEIAAIHLDIGEPEAAVESLNLTLPLVDRAVHPDVAARVLTSLAHTLGGLNRYAEAIGVYEDALGALRDVDGVDPSHTADVLRSLGQTHEAQGQRPEAAQAYRRALNILERHTDASPRQQRDILHQLARVTAALGDGTAVSLYEQVRDMTREWGDDKELGLVLCELADVHRDAERYPLAIQNYQSALECHPAPPFMRERINTLRNMGRAYAQMERFEDARAAWTEALELSNNLPEQSPVEIGLTHHAIGEAYRSQGHYEDAERSYREALEHHAPKSVDRAATLRALGQALHAAGRADAAIPSLREALDIEKSQPQQANARLVETLQLLAAAHEDAGNASDAITRHHEALVYMDRTLQPVAYADTLRTLGRLYREAGRYAEAHQAYEDALGIETSHVPRSDDRISATLQAIADTWRAQGNLEKAAEFYQKVTVYANMARRASEDLRATLDELDRRRGTLQAAEQSLALLDRNADTTVKDRALILALIAHSHARLSQPQDSADTIHTLLDLLDEHQDELDTDHADRNIRALGWLLAAHHAEGADDFSTAEFACGAALEAVQNADVRWVIEQIMRALEE